MGTRHDDRSSRPDPRNPRSAGPRSSDARERRSVEPRDLREREWTPRRVYDRDADMGGSGWSGASGRGGMSYAPRRDDRSSYGAPDYGDPHGRDFEERRRFAHVEEEGERYRDWESEPRREDYPARRYAHVAGQRWSGGYGGDADRVREHAGSERAFAGRGFTGNDFGSFEDPEDRSGRFRNARYPEYGYPGGYEPERGNAERHFGNAVDRGGRIYEFRHDAPRNRPWRGDPRQGFERRFDPRAHHDIVGYGDHGTDMGMGAMEQQERERRGPHYGKGPKGYKRSDERIRERVCDVIAHQGHIDASDVDVSVVEGVVALSGTVAHRHHKRALEQMIEHLQGVDEVHNQLRLKRDSAPEVERAAPTPAPPTPTRTTPHAHQNGKTPSA